MPNPTTAAPLDSATEWEKWKTQALLSLWLPELADGESPSLEQALDGAGRKAKLEDSHRRCWIPS